MKPVALTIAGSDPSGGAGIQADLKTFHQFGVYGEAVITLLTVQNTMRVDRVECLPAPLVVEQLEAVLEDIPPQAAKTGALGNAEIVRAVAEAAARFSFPLVVDPVMISKHGAALVSREARVEIRDRLLAQAALVTPNFAEAEELAGVRISDLDSMERAARRIMDLGARAVLVKGGHSAESANDLLVTPEAVVELPAPRIATPHTHGTGCTYSAAVAACLAQGLPLVEAVRRAKAFIHRAIETNPGLGRGCGPVNHHAPVASEF
jgi:hydroxymethylpyrimidine/phosphomethylpyrimidine kinase